jgi:TusA-related sulfurtransferase
MHGPQIPPPTHRIDITSERCPMTLVRTRLALDRMQPGEILEVLLSGEEPRKSVPEATFMLGHDVLSAEDLPNGQTAVLIQKN